MSDSKNALTAEAYNIIKKQIIDLNLRPGEIILVQQMAKNLNISRTPVREALVRLKQEGLVDDAEGRKFKVAELTLQTIMEIYEVRNVLESLAIEKATSKLGITQINKLYKIIECMKEALSNENFNLFFEQDLYFHNYLNEICGNKTLEEMLNKLNDKLQRIRYLTRNINKRVENTIDEHLLIVNYMEKGDPQGAKHALQEHLNKVKIGIEQLFNDSSKNFFLKSFIKI